MRIGETRRNRIERQRERLRREGWEPPLPEPGQEPPPRLIDIRCGKCGAKIAEVSRNKPGDVIQLPPDQIQFDGDLPHPWTVIVWCERCRQKRALIHHPDGPPAKNGGPKKIT